MRAFCFHESKQVIEDPFYHTRALVTYESVLFPRIKASNRKSTRIKAKALAANFYERILIQSARALAASFYERIFIQRARALAANFYERIFIYAHAFISSKYFVLKRCYIWFIYASERFPPI